MILNLLCFLEERNSVMSSKILVNEPIVINMIHSIFHL